MNRKNLLLAFLVFWFGHFTSYAQIGLDTSTAIIDSLFEYAWEYYPENAVVEYQASKAFYGMRSTQYAWSKDIGAQFNLNEFQINPSANTNGNLFFPKYNFGVRVDLGLIFQRPHENKKARQEYNAAMWQVEQQKSDIRQQIVLRVQMYKLSKSLLKIKTQALEESNTLQIVIKQRFQRNEITIEEYNNANISNLKFLEDKFNAEAKYNLAKNDLETLVGRKLNTLRFLPKDF